MFCSFNVIYPILLSVFTETFVLDVPNIRCSLLDFKIYQQQRGWKGIKKIRKWVHDCCLTPNDKFFSYIMTITSYFRWDDNDVSLYLTNTLHWIFIVLAHSNNGLWVDMSLNSNTLSWFRVNQSLLFLFNAECLNPRCTTFEVSTRTITMPMQFLRRIQSNQKEDWSQSRWI